jgi:hypothetical protein
VLELTSLDLEEIALALADQGGYEHRWLINPQTGEIVFWTSDTGIDGQTPVDLDELDLVGIDPLPSWIWYQDMADFAEAITCRTTCATVNSWPSERSVRSPCPPNWRGQWRRPLGPRALPSAPGWPRPRRTGSSWKPDGRRWRSGSGKMAR